MMKACDYVLLEVHGEMEKAEVQHPRYSSAHEAYGVLVEEVAEFFDEVRKKRADRDPEAMRKELIQIAAVACRAIVSLDL